MKGDFRIGDWLVQPQLNSMQRREERIRLEPKVMQVLVQLASSNGEVLTKSDLIERVWPGTFVGEQVLTRCVSELRRVLHEDPRAPQYIQNVPRVGYRLIVPPQPAENSDQQTRTGPQLSAGAILGPPEKRVTGELRSRAQPRIIGFAALAVIFATTAGFLLYKRNLQPDLAVRTVPFTSFPGSQSQPSFSPNGNEIAFVWSEHGEASNIYVKLLNSETPLEITSGDGRDQSPAWSPDGSQIAFIRYGSGKQTVCLVPALGGAVRSLYELHRTIDWDAPGLSWSPDGNWLIFPDAQSVDDPSAIYALFVRSLQTKVLTVPPNSSDGDYNPVFSPDGKHIAFVRGTDAAVRNLFIMNTDGTDLRALTLHSRTIAGIAWTPDSSNLVFSSDLGGSLSLWRVPLSGGTPERLTVGGDNATGPAVSLKDNRLAFSEGSAEWSTMRLDLSASVRKPVVLFSSTEKDSAVQYSPDDSLIAFQSLRSGSQEIWISQIDGTKPVRLTSFDGSYSGSPSWSPDGRQIAFDSRSGGWSHIFVMTAEGHNIQALTSGNYNDVIPSWSANGSWIYFGSRRSGRWEVWKCNLQSRKIQQVTNTGGFVARESPDSKWLYYTKYHHSGLWRMPSSGGPEERMLDWPPSEFWGYWSINSAGIYYLNDQGAHVVVELWTPSDGRSVVMVTLERKPPPFSGIAVSPDNHWLAYSDGASLTRNIRLVENFR